jgi:hypothetical protein
MRISDYTTSQLKNQAVELYDIIYNVGCFNHGDMQLLYAIEDELKKRGYIFTEKNGLKISKQ